MSFQSSDGPIIVEVSENDYGVERVARGTDKVIDTGKSIQEAVAGVRPAIKAVVHTLKDLAPKESQIEFGIKLNAETGVVIAKTSVEGHFIIRLKWAPDSEQE